MNDINSPTNFNPNQPRKRLKKVKRPVKRIPPQGANPMQPQYSGGNNFQQNKNTYQNDIDPFNADIYLNDANLPSVINDEQSDAPSFASVPQGQPNFINDENLVYEQAMPTSVFSNPNMAKKVTIFSTIIAFIIGIIGAKIFFTEPTVVRDGLQGVVVNSEVPRGRARCGVAEKTQGCVLYIMNPQRQELNASDFYDLASQLTGRQRFIIETGNMRYSNRKIKPGEIAQFNIPPLQ